MTAFINSLFRENQPDGAPAKPPAFEDEQWVPLATGESGQAAVLIASLPEAEPPISSIEFRIGALGDWLQLSPASPGQWVVPFAFADGVETGIAIRGVNSIGPALASTSKPVTTTSPSEDVTISIGVGVFTTGSTLFATVNNVSNGQSVAWGFQDDGADIVTSNGSGVWPQALSYQAAIGTDDVANLSNLRAWISVDGGSRIYSPTRQIVHQPPAIQVSAAASGDPFVGQTLTGVAATFTGDGLGQVINDWQVSSDGANGWSSANTTGLTGPAMASGLFYRMRSRVSNSGGSATSFSNVIGPATFAPVLSGVSVTVANNELNASLTTDIGEGTLFWVVDTTPDLPTEQQIALGQNEAGADGDDKGSIEVAAAGVVNFSNIVQLEDGQSYYLHAVQRDDEGRFSNILTSTAFTIAPEVPDAFGANMWAISPTGNAGKAAITINVLPANNGEEVFAIQYRIDAGIASDLASAGLSTEEVGDFTDGVQQSVEIRAVNSVGEGPWSDVKTVTTEATNSVPDQFDDLDFTVEATGVSGQIRVNITSLPNDNGLPIQVIQRNINSAGWEVIQQGANSTGAYFIEGQPDGVEASIEIRAVNADGPGPASNPKTATPFVASAALSVTTTGDGEVQVENAGDGAASITISGGTDYDGTYAVANLSDLADGPLNLVAPIIEDDGTPDVGETLTKRPGLWLYNTDNGAEPTITQQWQADDAGDAVFADISGADGDSYTVAASEQGDGVRVLEAAAQGAESRTANSAAVSIPAAAPPPTGTDASLSDTFVDTNGGEVITIPSVNIGAADPARKVVVMFGAKANTNLVSLTIGGVAAAPLHDWDTTNNPDIAVYQATVTAGTTADIVFTFGNSNPSGIFGGVVRYTTGTAVVSAPIEDQTASVDLSATISGSGAFVAGLAATEGNSATGWTWSGLANEAIDVQFRGSGTDNIGSVAWETNIASGARSITATVDGSPNSEKSLGIILEVA